MNLLLKTTSALLVAFYALVAILAFNPEVSEAYRDYYIDRNIGLTVTERKDLPPVRLGTIYSHRTKDIGFVGWSAPEERHRWTQDHRAKIVFRVDTSSSGGIPGEMRLNVFPLGRQRLQWQLNSGPWEKRLIGSSEEWRVFLDPEQIRPGENVLQILLPDARIPGNGDTRLSAIALQKLVFLPPGKRDAARP